MKRDTKIRALSRLIDRGAAEAVAQRAAAHAALTARRRSTSKELAAKAAENAWTANQAAATADEAWKAIAKPQRDYATAAAQSAVALAVRAAGAGGSFSGDTERGAQWGATTSATTTKTKGAQYSRRCTYRKTDARHLVTITPEGVVDLIDSPAIASASAREGLPLIAYTAATGAAVWVECKAKSICAVSGWIGSAGGCIYHSEKSAEDAARGADRKAGAAEREATKAKKSARAERRARLVVRLCRGAVATVADALAAGFCPAGIRAWQERNGIGDAAPLADLVKTGDLMATRLALDLARKVKRGATVPTDADGIALHLPEADPLTID
jgi:hypothetical protein